jgi:hypothetical protein
LKDVHEKQEFIQKCLTAKEHLFVTVLASNSQANFSYIENQVNQLRNFSRHNATKLHQELEQIIGYGELIDITNELVLTVKPKAPMQNF